MTERILADSAKGTVGTLDDYDADTEGAELLAAIEAPEFPDHTDCNCALCRARFCIEELREDNAQMRAAVGMFDAANKKLRDEKSILNLHYIRRGKQRREAGERILTLEGAIKPALEFLRGANIPDEDEDEQAGQICKSFQDLVEGTGK